MARAAQSGPSAHGLSTLQVGSTQEDSEAPTHVLGSEPPLLVSMLPWDREGHPYLSEGVYLNTSPWRESPKSHCDFVGIGMGWLLFPSGMI